MYNKLFLSKTKFLVLFYFATCLTLGIYVMTQIVLNPIKLTNFQLDYLQFYSGAKIAKQGGLTEIYSTEAHIEQQNPFETYRSLPFVALAMTPFAELNFWVSYKAFVLFSTLILTITIVLTSKSKNEAFAKIILLISFYPFMTSIYNGQVTLIITAAIIAGLHLIKKNKEFYSGIVFSLILIKPHFALLIFFLSFILKKKFTFIGGFILGSLILYSVGVFDLGLFYIFDYIEHLITTENFEKGTSFTNVSSFQSLYYYVVSNNWIFTATIITSIIGYLSGTLVIYKKAFTNDYTLIAVSILITLIFGLHAYPHDYLMALPAIYIFLENKKLLYSGLLHIIGWMGYTSLPFLSSVGYIIFIIYIYWKKQRTHNI